MVSVLAASSVYHLPGLPLEPGLSSIKTRFFHVGLMIWGVGFMWDL